MQFFKWATALILATLGAAALAADASERGFIRKGMKEAEVIHRIGRPDHETYIRSVRGQPEEKAWSYFPAPNDEQTLTIITLRAGVVSEVERKIAR
jgi:hypothetical protein